jgi:hypothetical protein
MPKKKVAYQDFLKKGDYFVIEREPGTGFHVKLSGGPNAQDEERQRRALKLLEELPQPDLASDKEKIWWVEPTDRIGEFALVWMEAHNKGEPRYREFWFKVQDRPTRTWTKSFRKVFVGLATSLLVLVALFIFLGWIKLNLPNAGGQVSVGTGEQPSPTGQRTASEQPGKDPRVDSLLGKLILSQSERDKLKKYLSQPDFGANADVVKKERCIKLIADLDRSPPPQESLQLDTIEVRHLLELLQELDRFEKSGDVTKSSEGLER